jgi:hypothetical protein
MDMRSEYRARTLAEWQELWALRPSVFRLPHSILGPESQVQSLVNEACHFLGGVARSSRFRLFRNGGLPLLERRNGAWTEEILFLSPPTGRNGIWAPITIQLHLSCEDFFEIRHRYWSVLAKPPRVVARGNIGELEGQDQRILWNLAAGSPTEPVVETIADHLVNHGIPWFDGFGNPARLRRQLFDTGVPLFDSITALEWCLYAFGVEVASDYLNHVVLLDEELGGRVDRLLARVDHDYLEGGPDLPVATNIAALVATYGLRHQTSSWR